MNVFIIDDYFDLARPLADNFRFKGHKAEYCIDSKNALQIALAFKPDWIIFDIRMPFRNGAEVIKGLSETANFEFSAVFYSNYVDDPAIREEPIKLDIPEEAMIRKTGDIDSDVDEKLIPALKAGYLKGGKKK